MGPRHQNLHSTTHWAATLDGRTYEEVEAFLVPACWMLIAMVVAVRHALDYTSTARALGVCVLGWAFSLTVAAVIGILFATPVL